jgi:glycosyltransferase involved in cell wall biosynthesis
VNRARDAYRGPSSIEVIVVNNASTDGTDEVARRCGATVLLEEKRCIAAVRNSGVRASSGRILAFLDADSLVLVNVFNAVHETMASGEFIGGSTGVKLDRRSAGLFVTMCMTVFPARWLFGVSGGLYFTERSTFDELGGFDEGLYCAEDTAFLLALRRHGKRVGKEFRILKKEVTTTSSRSFDRFGDWFYVSNLPRILAHGGTRAFRSREFCSKYW